MNTRSISCIEALETRTAPAVIVDFTSGVLSLTGDGADNSFSIEALSDGRRS